MLITMYNNLNSSFIQPLFPVNKGKIKYLGNLYKLRLFWWISREWSRYQLLKKDDHGGDTQNTVMKKDLA